MNTIQGNLSLNGKEKIAIINARFNHFITDSLVAGARDSFLRHGGDERNLDLILVPGAFEVPFALRQAIKSAKYDAIVCLGAIIRGDTPHFDYVAAESTKGIAAAGLDSSIPVSFGILTVDNVAQAIDRAGVKAGNKGFEAMNVVIEMIDLYRNIKG